ncbi:LysR family transcriptional regulator [Agarivorans sp. Alg241-V36]|uniref:LysR family transcriptional regulator n=1 Tax=Agarivorans sp. Alg241-V36 TaxID=2305992 RepID=UPI0013D22111|nr:LysR family transcriptional regulator [Agarivorans sp. Alg241-V36]
MNFSLHQLQAFVLAAELGSFSAAARKMRKAHSAVSTAISNLELDVGQELFDRSAREPVLTTAGEVLFSEAKSILANCRYFEQLASELHPQQESQFTIAIDDYFDLPKQQELLMMLAERFPNLELRVREALSQDIIALVTKGEADIGFTLLQQAVSSQMSYMPMPDVQLHYLVSPKHELAQLAFGKSSRKPTQLHQLERYRQGILARSSYFSSQQISAKVWKVDTLFAAAELAASGACWIMSPPSFVRPLVETGSLVSLPVHQDLQRSIPSAVIWRSQTSQGLVHQAVRSWVQEKQVAGEISNKL